jgi:glycosyltransferase involved in cell wall biosynthesis
MADPLASVVIPTLNGGDRFKKCIEAVKEQDLPGGFEIVVIDSGSFDGTAEFAQENTNLIRIKKEDFNHGRARNQAISECRGKAVALLVQDAVPLDKNWLRYLVETVLEDGVAGVYSRQVPRPDCPPFIRARLERWSASTNEREVKVLSGEDELMSLPILSRIGRISFDNVSSCIRKDVWEKHPFPERRFGEDAAWSREALLAGYKVIFEPRSVVEHSHANSMWYEFKRIYLDHRNWREVAGGALFNNPFEVLHASINGIPERWKELDEQNLGGLARVYWRFYAIPYSFSQNFAQYLGARSMKAVMKLSWYKYIDDFLAKGV